MARRPLESPLVSSIRFTGEAMTAFTRIPAFVACLASCATLAVASTAAAATLTRGPDGALVVTAAPGEQNHITLGGPMDGNPGEIAVGDRLPITATTTGCGAADYVVDCQVGPAG